MDKLGQDAILAREEKRLSGAARELSALRGEVASDAVADYFLRKKVLVGYETAVAGLLGLTSARDSLREILGDQITVRRNENGDLVAEIAASSTASASQMSVVAGAGFGLYLLEPTTILIR